MITFIMLRGYNNNNVAYGMFLRCEIGLLYLPDTGVTTHERKAAMFFFFCFRLFISRWAKDILLASFCP